MSTLVIGVDPGGTTGVFAFAVLSESDVVVPFLGPVAAQIRGWEGVEPLLTGLLNRTKGERQLMAVEDFVIGGRTARSAHPAAGQRTRILIGTAREIAADHGAEFHTRPAATVKPWATDKRLDAAGLLAATRGMPHARDAARQALYAAVHSGLIRDPLSKATAS